MLQNFINRVFVVDFVIILSSTSKFSIMLLWIILQILDKIAKFYNIVFRGKIV